MDSHNFPNLCLMKLSAYHKAQGHQVMWWNPLFYFDVVYKSRVFTDTYSKDKITVTNAGTVIKGGTGYGPGPDLPDEIEHTYPDYSLYPQYSETAYGFLSRGCPRGCGFCIVGGKEGRRSRKVADLSEFWRGQREIKLMDANLLACPDHESLLLQLADSRALVDFSQGLDIEKTKHSFQDLLTRLQTDYIDVGMIHYVDSEEDFRTVFDGPVLEYAKELKAKGVIHHIGMSSHNPHIALKAVESGCIDVLMFSINPAYDMESADTDIYDLMEFKGMEKSGLVVDEARQRLYSACESEVLPSPS